VTGDEWDALSEIAECMSAMAAAIKELREEVAIIKRALDADYDELNDSEVH